MPHKELTTLTCTSTTRLTKVVSFLIIFILFLIFLAPPAAATDYTVRPSISKEPGASVYGENVKEVDPIPYWLYLILLVFPQLTAMPLESLLSIKLLPYLGYKKIARENILDNSIRLKIYNFIKEHPGIYFREIIKRTELNKGTVGYHLEIMKTEKMIESNKTNGKLRYFLNNSTYTKEEQTVISVLKNDVHRKIILEILNNQSINHKTLAEQIGVSAPTITQHIKHLKEQGIVKADTNGRYTNYSIDSNYFDSLQKYMSITP
ncbi:winged helix-turn-helix transcriptional regulator [Candidatus Methanoperedens nitratireducens]|uniref:winged helix-turn-helix transcriptional regulator n=1 Tax=Candidatus Methanoperedens nitratireducens TaxID=1392998 RepID=UPI0015C96CE5|nr:winged helix-turn-helix transcriptional regulator [Candidatus Methanoperedens nitroreducens]